MPVAADPPEGGGPISYGLRNPWRLAVTQGGKITDSGGIWDLEWDVEV